MAKIDKNTFFKIIEHIETSYYDAQEINKILKRHPNTVDFIDGTVFFDEFLWDTISLLQSMFDDTYEFIYWYTTERLMFPNNEGYTGVDFDGKPVIINDKEDLWNILNK